MRQENPELFSLRCVTLKAIEKLLQHHKAATIKEAAKIVFNTCRRKHQNPGFPVENFQKFYNSIRKFKSNFHKISQAEKFYLYDVK